MAAEKRDYYEVLDVPRDADDRAIKSRFRELALKYHPDRNKEPGAEAKFKEIAEAYAVLSDPKKRAEYDARGMAGVAGFSPDDLFGGIDFETLFDGHGFDFGLGEAGGPFGGLFGSRRRRGPVQGANIEVDVRVPLDMIATGGEETVRYARPTECPGCHGSGAEPGTEPQSCKACDGTGRLSRTERKTGVFFQQFTTCASCGGRGTVIEKPCSRCRGRGQVEEHESVTVKIPPGIEERIALRVPGRGMPSSEPGGPTGDLFVVVRSDPDPRFVRRGADLWHTEMISVSDAALGAKREVPTLDGTARVTIPEGTQPEEVLRLRGKGLPVFGSADRGDLYLVIRIRIPDRLSRRERELYRRLRELES
ncbi:MAG: DnaJ C-terminal domain-containing protein [Planctomycetota bacterium]|jgi:molecular chaperone DnaJ